MLTKYRSASRLGKMFVWLSIGIIVVAVALYIHEVREALAMDPNSYNCTSDSMMMQICEDPYGTSVFWALLILGVVGWPALLSWLIIGIILIRRRNERRSTKNDEKPLIS